MKKVLACLSMLMLWSTAQAAPYVSGIAGTASDDQQVTIHGTGFGSHPLKIEWLGGKSGAIESGTPGAEFSGPGWGNLTGFKPTYDTSRAYSGSKSILFDSVRHGDGRFGLVFDPGAPLDFGYATWMAYIDTGGANGQWKMFRMNWDYNLVDTNPELVMFNWFGSSDTLNIRRVYNDIDERYYPKGYPEQGEWVRMELYLKPSSAPGRADGSVEVWAHRPGKAIEKIADLHNLETYLGGEANRWRYYVFQNYQGNGLAGSSRVWMDDIYLQGTRARVEIGNAPTWDACTRREVQRPTSWQDGSVTFAVNQGTFRSGEQVYLYVVDGSGSVNPQGYPLTIGAAGNVSLPSPQTPAPAKAPSAPQNLAVLR